MQAVLCRRSMLGLVTAGYQETNQWAMPIQGIAGHMRKARCSGRAYLRALGKQLDIRQARHGTTRRTYALIVLNKGQRLQHVSWRYVNDTPAICSLTIFTPTIFTPTIFPKICCGHCSACGCMPAGSTLPRHTRTFKKL